MAGDFNAQSSLDNDTYRYTRYGTSMGGYHFVDNERTLVALRYLGGRSYTVGKCGNALLF